MSIEHRCKNCGFAYEIRVEEKVIAPCPNCGSEQTEQDNGESSTG